MAWEDARIVDIQVMYPTADIIWSNGWVDRLNSNDMNPLVMALDTGWRTTMIVRYTQFS